MPAYDLYVRPYVRPINASADKGKARDVGVLDAQEGSSRIPHGLKDFLYDLPGRTSTKKSESIADLMMQAPKQRVEISPFDPRTLENFRLPDGYRVQPQNPDDSRKKKKKPRPDGAPGQNTGSMTPSQPSQSR